jgi:CobQ-like glutamine amidotransferase family enzyme
MIRTAWMYPDTLYLHGERGNVMALARYADMLGTGSRTHKVDMGTEDFDPMDYDVIFYGPGELPSFPDVIEEISSYRDRLIEFIESGRVLLVTGTSLAMFGESISMAGNGTSDGGQTVKGLGIIPVKAAEREYVFGDDEYVVTTYGGREMELIGNQIQMADIEIVPAAFGVCRSFGKVKYGRGNNGRDGLEGIIRNNSIFTNMTGPILTGNPWLAVEIIRRASSASGSELSAAEPPYEMELKSLELKKQFIAQKSPQEK